MNLGKLLSMDLDKVLRLTHMKGEGLDIQDNPNPEAKCDLGFQGSQTAWKWSQLLPTITQL